MQFPQIDKIISEFLQLFFVDYSFFYLLFSIGLVLIIVNFEDVNSWIAKQPRNPQKVRPSKICT